MSDLLNRSRWSAARPRPPRIVTCIGCGQKFSTMATRSGFESCSITCRIAGGIERRGPNECWPWTGLLDKDGYGEFGFAKKKYKAHRASLEIKLGRPIFPGLHAMHSCDFPACCNPDHLSEGTSKQNNDDMIAKGRAVVVRGEDHSASVLTEKAVLEIRASSDPLGVLASRFNVKIACISKVRLRQRWRHIR
jgi:hypothetical protein